MADRRLVGALVALGMPLLAAAPAHGEDFTTFSKERLRIANLLDDSIGMVNEYEGKRVKRGRWNSIDALVVARDMNFAELARQAPRDLVRVKPGVWELRRTVIVTNGATLTISDPRLRELRLISDPTRWASIVTRNASLRFRGDREKRLLIHSWNPKIGRPDKFLEDGRSTISVRWRGRLDSFDTTFAHLGFYEGRVSGVAVIGPEKHHGGTGNVYRSRFEGNVYGAFTYQADRMRWVGNEFVKNIVYGFDPHDASNNFLTERNYAAENGKHGIIFSRFCAGNIIRDNVSENNGWHGIVLDDGKAADGPSNFNEVYNNTVRNNGRVGISIDGSQRTIIRDNQISGHRYGIRLYGPTTETMIRDNVIKDSRSFGIFVDRPTHSSWIVNNKINTAFTGVRVRGAHSTMIQRNEFTNMDGHAVKFDGENVSGSRVSANPMAGQGTSPIYLELKDEQAVAVDENPKNWDYHFEHDLARFLAWGVGPAFWVGLLGLALIGPLLLRAAGVLRRRPQ